MSGYKLYPDDLGLSQKDFLKTNFPKNLITGISKKGRLHSINEIREP